MRVSILQGSSTGTVVYEETYSPNPQTNANGLVTVKLEVEFLSMGLFRASTGQTVLILLRQKPTLPEVQTIAFPAQANY